MEKELSPTFASYMERNKKKKSKPAKLKIEETANKVSFKEYERAVREARQYVNNYDEVRFKIVEICLSVCEVSLGGRKNSTIYTMKKFADDIGVVYRTLNNWTRTKTMVVDKLPAKLLKNVKYSYTDLEETLDRIGHDKFATTAQVKQAFNDQMNTPIESRKFIRYLDTFNSVIFNLSRPIKSAMIEEQYLKEMQEKARTIIGLIDVEYKLRGKFSTEERVNKQLQKRKEAVNKFKELQTNNNQGVENVIG